MAAENNLHQGHRERMRERIAQQGFESLADHEALEVLLYLTNPRKNTNVMAHALLKRFGSFPGCWTRRKRSCAKWRAWGLPRPGCCISCPKSANTIPAAAPVRKTACALPSSWQSF